MSTYSCKLAAKIGRKYNLCPEQVWPGMLRTLSSSWRPGGSDLSGPLTADADRLERALRRRGLPQRQPVQADEDGRMLARAAMGGSVLLAEMERGWERRDARNMREGE